jgi:hypothetical protein
MILGGTAGPGFPTQGRCCASTAYGTWWFGKWHLTHGDNHWRLPWNAGALERYGFSGGTYPSPDGGPGQGWRMDPYVADQFDEWYGQASDERPWCTTVSFVNPHDIAWWHRWSARFPAEAPRRRGCAACRPTSETPPEAEAHDKPRLQRSLQATAAASFGPVPFTGAAPASAWLPFLDSTSLPADRGQSHRTELRTCTAARNGRQHGRAAHLRPRRDGASHGLRGARAGP